MSYLFLVLGLIVFLFLIRRLGIVATVRTALRRASSALTIMRDASVPDRDKERALQRAAARLAVAFVDILGRSVAAFAVPLAGIYAGVVAGLFSTGEAMAAAWNPAFLIAMTALAVVAWRFVR